MRRNGSAEAVAVVAMVILVVAAILLGLWLVPKYKVYSQTMRGKAALREAEWSRQILIEEANASRQAEITRAEGVAEANKIIGESLSGNEDYLRYLWIQGLNDGSGEVIYIPTEANLPILEATRRAAPN